jgi:hypothetical protein
MLNVLRPLHHRIEQGHITLKEQSFNQTYFKDLRYYPLHNFIIGFYFLRDAYEHTEAFKRSNNQKGILCHKKQRFKI